MELRQIALEVARILQDAGKHALNDQMNPHDMRKLEVSEDCFHFTSDTDKRLQQFISNRLTYVNVFDGFWQLRPEQCYPRPAILVCGWHRRRDQFSREACRNGPSP